MNQDDFYDMTREFFRQTLKESSRIDRKDAVDRGPNAWSTVEHIENIDFSLWTIKGHLGDERLESLLKQAIRLLDEIKEGLDVDTKDDIIDLLGK